MHGMVPDDRDDARRRRASAAPPAPGTVWTTTSEETAPPRPTVAGPVTHDLAAFFAALGSFSLQTGSLAEVAERPEPECPAELLDACPSEVLADPLEVATPHGLEVRVDSRLAEHTKGVLENTSFRKMSSLEWVGIEGAEPMRELYDRVASGGPVRTRRRTASPAQREAERAAARRAACEVSCGEETLEMLNRSLTDAELTRIANAHGLACTRACGSDATQ